MREEVKEKALSLENDCTQPRARQFVLGLAIFSRIRFTLSGDAGTENNLAEKMVSLFLDPKMHSEEVHVSLADVTGTPMHCQLPPRNPWRYGYLLCNLNYAS